MTTRIEVGRAIAAEPHDIFEILRSPDGHVAIDASGMLMSADGEPARRVGDTFVVHMDREALNDYPLGLYDVTVVIGTFEQGREIAWTIDGQIQPPIGHVYGYRLEPIDGGAFVTSYYDWTDIHPEWKERDIFPIISEGALRSTLGIRPHRRTRQAPSRRLTIARSVGSNPARVAGSDRTATRGTCGARRRPRRGNPTPSGDRRRR